MLLPPGVVRHPASGPPVEQLDWSLLTAVGAGLPGKQRPFESGFAGEVAGGVEPAPAVEQQRFRDLGQPQVHQRQHEELIPEDVAAIPLAVQSAGRGAGVGEDGVRGQRLQQVEGVQVQQQLGVRVGFDLDVEALPQPLQGSGVPGQQVLVADCRQPVELIDRAFAHGGERIITGVDQGCRRVDADSRALAHLDGGIGEDAGGVLDRMHLHSGVFVGLPDGVLADVDLGALGDGDAQLALARLDLGQQRAVGTELLEGRHEVLLRQRIVLTHVVVDDVHVDTGAHNDRIGGVDRRDLREHRCDVLAVHRHEPLLADDELSFLRVTQRQLAGEHTVGERQRALAADDLQPAGGEPVAVGEPDVADVPVRQIDQRLVLKVPAVDMAPQPVEDPSHVRTGVMGVPSRRLGSGSAQRHVPVRQRRQRLPAALMLRLEAGEAQLPGILGHDAQVELIGVGDDHIRPGCLQIGAVAVAGDADDEAELTSAGGLDTGDGVFEHRAVPRWEAEQFGGGNERVGGRFAGQAAVAGDLTVDDDVEEVGDAGGLQKLRGVAAGGHETNRGAAPAQPLDELDGAGEHFDALAFEQHREVVVLAPGQPVDGVGRGRIVIVAFGQEDVAGVEEGAYTVLAGPAVDVAAVVLDPVEGGGVDVVAQRQVAAGHFGAGEHVVEQPLPGDRMQRRRVGDDAVHVEDDR